MNTGQLLPHKHQITKEVRRIANKSAPINVIVHYPKTGEGMCQLAERVASVHADMVTQYIQKLNCPLKQKLQLLDAVIESASKQQNPANPRYEMSRWSDPLKI